MSEHRSRLLALIQSLPVKYHHNWGNISTDLMRGIATNHVSDE